MKLSIPTVAAVICILCLVVFTSCNNNKAPSGNTDTNTDTDTNTNQTPGTDDTGNKDTVQSLYIVFSEDTEFDTYAVRMKLKDCSNFDFKISDGTENAGKLFIGRGDSVASEKAYRALDRLLDDQENLSGYAVYAFEGNLAIAFDSGYALYDALDALVTLLSGNSSVTSSNGTLAKGSFEFIERLDDERANMRDQEFARLEDYLGAEAIQSLRNLYEYYGRDMYTWIANLWDPITGGFYYSASGRDTEGFLPDLESTRQALSCLTQAGMFTGYGDNYAKALPEDIKASIISFVNSLQSSTDGYFYHPQWGTAISTTRRGRDLDWAETLLKAFGAKPLYDTPNNMKGTLGAPGQGAVPAAKYLTERLGKSVVGAVSKVVLTNTALPAYLTNLGEFETYLNEMNISGSSYSVGNQLAATATQIVSAGKEYVDLLENYLDNRQNKENGLWEDSVTFESVNGLMKISQTYTIINRPFPNPEKAIQSAIQIALEPDLAKFSKNDEHICSVYNPWVAMAHVLNGSEKTLGKEETKKIRQLVLDRADDLVNATAKKLGIFKRTDGGFSYTPYASAENSSGVPVALPKCVEGDMNATSIGSTGTMSSMFTVLGITPIDMYTDEDCRYFLDLLMDMGEIVKSPAPETERYTFDYYNSQDNPTENGVLLSPEEGVTTTVGDKELSLSDNYKWFSSNVVENPAKGADDEDLVLKSETYLYPGEAKDKASNDSKTAFSMKTTDKDGNCYVFDASLLVNGVDGLIGQIFFTKEDELHTLGLAITAYTEDGKQYLKFGEVYTGLDTVKDGEVAVKVPCGEWFNLRIELYKDFENASELIVNAKIFVNGKLQGECDGGYFSTVSNIFINRLVDRVIMYYYRGNNSTVYFNSVLCERIDKEFVSEDPDRPVPPPPPERPELPPQPTIPTPPTNPVVEDYEKYSEGEQIGYIVNSGSATGYEAEIGVLAGNKFLKINNRANTGTKYIKHAVVTNAQGSQSYKYFTFATELTIDSLRGTHTIQNLRFSGTGTTYSFTIDIMADGSIKLSSVNTDTKENYYYITDAGVIKAGTKHTLKLVGDTEIGGDMALYVDGKYIAGAKVAKAIEGIGFVLQSNAEGVLSFDNTYFVMYNENADEDEPETPETPETPDDPVVPNVPEPELPLPENPACENFENKTLGENIGTVIGSGITEGYTSTIVDNNGNKMLEIAYPNGGGTSYIKQAIVTNPSDGGSYKYFLFETDITVDKLSGIITLQHLTASNTTTYSMFIDIGSDGSVTLSSYNTKLSPATKNSYKTAAGVIKAGTTHTIRVVGELEMGGVMALYIDGTYYGSVEVARTILSVGFIYQTNAQCMTLFDNCCFYLYNEDGKTSDGSEIPGVEIPTEREVEDFSGFDVNTAFQSLVTGKKQGGSLSMMVMEEDGNRAMIFRNKNGTDTSWYTFDKSTETEGEKYLFEAKIKLHSKFDGIKIYNYQGSDVTSGTNGALVIDIADGGVVALSSGENSATATVSLLENGETWYSVKVVGGTKVGEQISLYINDTIAATVTLAEDLVGYNSFKINLNPASVPSSGNLFWIDDCGVTFFN